MMNVWPPTIRLHCPLPCLRAAGLMLAFFFVGSMCRLAAGEVTAPPPAEAATGESPEPHHEWNFTDIEGKAQDPFADGSVQFLVVVFIATECPIANYYQPTLNRLAGRYRERGIRFLLFHPDPDITPKKLKEHAKAFKIASPVCADAEFTLARRLKASTTPEAFVIARDGSTKYRGRIDDIYAAWGKRRRKATSHDLQDALDALLVGKAVERPTTRAIGCYIPLEMPAGDGAGEGESSSAENGSK